MNGLDQSYCIGDFDTWSCGRMNSNITLIAAVASAMMSRMLFP
jgi:hypothetical protein